jgi:hypothetical protein
MPTEMTPKSLVLVLGAGASKEANLPTGEELKVLIAALLDIRYSDFSRLDNGDPVLASALHVLAESDKALLDARNEFLKTAWHIRESMPQAASIDNFIDSHRGNDRIAAVGKVAIARCILTAEAGSGMGMNRETGRPINFDLLADTWYNRFFRLVVEGCQKEGLPERLRRVAVVSFNYDRSFEQYFHLALQTYFRIPAPEAATILGALDIYHPYGTVGTLPWQGGAVAFGETLDAQALVASARELRTFTEGTDARKSDIDAIRALMATGERIAFLGFAFHRLNMDLLFAELQRSHTKPSRAMYATAKGMSLSNAATIARELASVAGLGDGHLGTIGDFTCTQLFTNYSRGLSLT